MELERIEFIKNFDQMEESVNNLSLTKPNLFDYLLNEEIMVGLDLKKVYLIQTGMVNPRDCEDIYLDISELNQAFLRAVQRYLPSISSKFRGITLRHQQDTMIIETKRHLPPEDIKELVELCKILCDYSNVHLGLVSSLNTRSVLSIKKSPPSEKRALSFKG